MEFVRLGGYGVGFVCRMRAGGCAGTVTVAYGGRVCGTLKVTNPKMGYVGVVVGPTTLEPGDSAIYYHDLGPGAVYTGSMPGAPFENELGNGIVATMPANAQPADVYSVSFSGPCKSTAMAEVRMSGCGGPCGAYTAVNGQGGWPGVGALVLVGECTVYQIGAMHYNEFGNHTGCTVNWPNHWAYIGGPHGFGYYPDGTAEPCTAQGFVAIHICG